LRLHDNPALQAAARASGGHVVPLFIVDDAVLAASRTGAARVAFMLDSLRALDRALRERGSRLVIRRGRPVEVLPKLAEQCDAAGVCWNRDYTPFAQARDTSAEAALRERGLDVQTYRDAMLLEPGELLTKSGTPYTVYTPYWKQWRVRVEAERAELLAERAPPDLTTVPRSIESLSLPSAAELGFETNQALPEGGEAAALKQLADFARLSAKHGIGGYHHGRECPALPATSRLSAYLRFGCIAPAACVRAALAASERTGGIKLSLNANVMTFASESPESGEGFDEVPVEYTGQALTVGFNAGYLLQVLSSIEQPDVVLGVSGELDPATLQPNNAPEGFEYLAVIMPMRI
jgi:deoxyribodipyrimidine photo-lyase